MSDRLSEIDGIIHALGEMSVRWGHYEDMFFILMFSVLGIYAGPAQDALRSEIDLKTSTAITKSAALVETKLPARDHVLKLVSWIGPGALVEASSPLRRLRQSGGSNVGPPREAVVEQVRKAHPTKPPLTPTVRPAAPEGRGRMTLEGKVRQRY